MKEIVILDASIDQYSLKMIDVIEKSKLFKISMINISKQLKKFGIKYHKLFISKPSADIYIDDKAYGYDKSWLKKFKIIELENCE